MADTGSGQRFVTSSSARLALSAVAVLAPVMTLFVYLIGSEVDHVLTETARESLRSELRLLRADFDRGGAEQLSVAVQQRSTNPGRMLYRLDLSVPGLSAGNLKNSYAQVGEGGLVFEMASAEGGRRPVAGIAVSVPGGGRLLVARDIGDQAAFSGRLRGLALSGLGLLSGLALALGWHANRRTAQRIDGIVATSRSIMAGDLSQRIPRDGAGDELDGLAGNLNDMLSRIEELMQALQEVSDNIAHDLKTPLTRLRNRAEAALRDSQPSAHREGLEKTIEEADGLIQTFNALLLIARLEAGAVEQTKALCDVSALVADVAELYQPVADEAGLSLAVATSESHVLAMNRQLIGQAVANLIDNAIKYSAGTPFASNGPIRVEVAKVSGDAVAISVADHGPGIPAADRARATKRFVRLEQSRSRPGTGLGLSLVAAVARLHGGGVQLDDNEPGLKITLVLPVGSATNA